MSNELIPTREELSTIESLAKYAQESKFFQTVGGTGGLISIMLYAKELGLPPMQCLFSGMHNIQGKIELSAALMSAMIRKAGHRIEILKSDKNVCSLRGTRKDSGDTWTETFTIQDAEQSGISNGNVWKKYPKNMLFARATKNLARTLFSDVIGSAYVEGEISEIPEEEKKTFSVEPIAEGISEKVEEIEQVEEKVDITPERSAEILSKFIGIENDTSLLGYITYAMEKTRSPLADVTNKWIEKKERFIEYFNAWKEKQALASKEVEKES